MIDILDAAQYTNAELRKKAGPWRWLKLSNDLFDLPRRRLVRTAEGREAWAIYLHLVMLATQQEPHDQISESLDDVADLTGIPKTAIEKALPLLDGWVEAEGQPAKAKKKPRPKLDSRFDDFWKAYPRKVGKPKAKAAWKRHKCDSRADQVIAAVEAWKCSQQWRKDGGQYVPHPATWLNRSGWGDQVETQAEAVRPRPVVREDA